MQELNIVGVTKVGQCVYEHSEMIIVSVQTNSVRSTSVNLVVESAPSANHPICRWYSMRSLMGINNDYIN